MSASNDNEIGFISTQFVYLRYLNSENAFSLTSQENEILVDFGTTNHTYAGFARSVYYRITGNRLVSNKDQAKPRSTITDLTSNNITVYPNPTNSDQITININKSNFQFDEHQNIAMEVYNMSGQRESLTNSIYKDNLQITLPRKGLFFVRVIVNGNIIGTSKVLNL